MTPCSVWFVSRLDMVRAQHLPWPFMHLRVCLFLAPLSGISDMPEGHGLRHVLEFGHLTRPSRQVHNYIRYEHIAQTRRQPFHFPVVSSTNAWITDRDTVCTGVCAHRLYVSETSGLLLPSLGKLTWAFPGLPLTQAVARVHGTQGIFPNPCVSLQSVSQR
jgi:hypothetical protein